MADALMLQWTLSQTADNFLKVGHDLIRAASADNIQPLTLLACSRFGATLAISPITRSKIHLMLKSQADHVFVKFLKVQVGYAAGDSAEILSQSMAGINFLALAAALVAVSSTFEAGCALESMIVASAADKSLVPTEYHLKDLLDVLEPRLNRAGFLSEALGWQYWWAHNGYNPNERNPRSTDADLEYPAPEAIDHIVASFRKLGRIGEASSIVFTVCGCAPWLSAFIKWCIGLPPNIYDQDGNTLLDHQGSSITLIYSTKSEYHLQIKIQVFCDYDTIHEVIHAPLVDKEGPSNYIARGMVELPDFARCNIRYLRLDDDIGRRALLQAVPYALEQVRGCCIFGRVSNDPPNIKSLLIQDFEPFPEDVRISNVMTRYLSLQNPLPLKKLDEGILISDLPLVRLWSIDHPTARLNDFVRRLSLIVANILAIALFDNSLDHLMLHFRPRISSKGPAGDDLEAYVLKVLLGDLIQPCSINKILSWAMEMVGHEVIADLDADNWVASSFRGQVVFPEVFETQSLISGGFLRLVCIPGILTSGSGNTQRFSRVKCLPAEQYGTKPQGFSTDKVTSCSNLFSSEKIQWRTSRKADCLVAGIGWTMDRNHMSPFDLLKAFSHAKVLRSCSHKPEEEVTCTKEDALDLRYLSPCESLHVLLAKLQKQRDRNKIGVYPVAKNDGLRLLSFASTMHLVPQMNDAERVENAVAVLNENACLTCLVKAARLRNCRHIVL